MENTFTAIHNCYLILAHQLLSCLLVIESIEAREQVKYVVMDMSPLFKLVIQTMVLHAHIVADRYHVCRLVDWDIEQKIALAI